MINIDLNLFATLRKFLPDHAGDYEIAENLTIGKLILQLNIPDKDVKLIFVNGKKQERSYILQDGDRVGLFPPVGGRIADGSKQFESSLHQKFQLPVSG